MKRRYIIAIAVGVIALIIAAFIYTRPHDALQGTLSRRAHIGSLFKGHTPQEALAAFKEENSKLDTADQHTDAHLFGEVLYEETGLPGFTVCDGSFGFGCYHSFIGLAIADHGTGVVKELDDLCTKEYGPGGTGCFHGIGHGVISYFGYTYADVDRALALCSELTWKRPLGGCADGVFMEYNFRTMATDPQERYRQFTEDTMYQPCTSVNSYKEACYFGLPAWWTALLPNDATLAPRTGSFCAAVTDTVMRRACYRGLGYGIMPQVDFDPKRGEDFCDASAKGGARLWCREGLAWAFYSDPAMRSLAKGACTDGLSEADVLQCDKEYLFVIQ